MKNPENSMTFGELFDLYFDKHVLIRNKNHENAIHFRSKHVPYWKDVSINNIQMHDVQDWVDDLGKRSPSSANRALDIMKAAINWGIKRRKIQNVNPCIGVEKFKTKPRERFLSENEIKRFLQALYTEPPIIRDMCLICLLTGARKGNVTSMEWKDIDFNQKQWTIPDTKNGNSLTLPLGPDVIRILERRRETAKDEIYVFPGKHPGTHRHELKSLKKIIEKAGIKHCTVHDLRRTYASHLAMQGASPFIVARLLGHKDLRSVEIYARLNLDSLRGPVEKVHSLFDVHSHELSKPICQPVKNVVPFKMDSTKPIPKNANISLTPADQIVVEGKIISAINAGATTKKAFYKKIGAQFKLNRNELERILNEMIHRGIIMKEPHEYLPNYNRYKLLQFQQAAKD